MLDLARRCADLLPILKTSVEKLDASEAKVYEDRIVQLLRKIVAQYRIWASVYLPVFKQFIHDGSIQGTISEFNGQIDVVLHDFQVRLKFL